MIVALACMENADVPQLEAPLDLDEGPNIRLLGFGPHISNGVIKEELQVSRGPVDESACITALCSGELEAYSMAETQDANPIEG